MLLILVFFLPFYVTFCEICCLISFTLRLILVVLSSKSSLCAPFDESVFLLSSLRIYLASCDDFGHFPFNFGHFGSFCCKLASLRGCSVLLLVEISIWIWDSVGKFAPFGEIIFFYNLLPHWGSLVPNVCIFSLHCGCFESVHFVVLILHVIVISGLLLSTFLLPVCVSLC